MSCQLELDYIIEQDQALIVEPEHKRIRFPSGVGRTPIYSDPDVLQILRDIREEYQVESLDDWTIEIGDVYLIIQENRIVGVRL